MVNVVFVSNTCSPQCFTDLQNIKYREKLAPSQKFFDMLIRGFSPIDDCVVTCLTARAIDPTNCKLKRLPYFEENFDGIKYVYTKIINKKIIKNINNIVQGKKIAKRIIRENSKRDVETVFVCDPLAYDLCYGVLLSARRQRVCGLYTDLPDKISVIGKSDKKTLLSRVKDSMRFFIEKPLKRFDIFCFITESMNEVNVENKPYVVIEGMTPGGRRVESEAKRGLVVYAGGLYEKFGVKKLVEAASEVTEIEDFELHLYGEGNCVDYINEVSQRHPNIKYMGAVSLDQILEKESQASLLVNPRPTGEDFTKYSFPSKTLEYMYSGRPVLTTKLSGIPDEYNDYLFFIEDESVEGIKNAIVGVLSRNESDLASFGKTAQDFAINVKNNERQALKLWNTLRIKN